jgi:hypothetical protein
MRSERRLRNFSVCLRLWAVSPLSKAARAKIAEAQRERWAKVRAKAPKRKYKKGTHWTQKPENKAKLRLVQKARKAA